MGQVQSEEYQCGGYTRDVADSEINSPHQAEANKEVIQSEAQNKMSSSSGASKSRKQQHVRKLSNVSHRNIQLLSMKPRSEKDAFVDDLQTRRRSSLINLILGAPSGGPRFSDDLCSLSSHLEECNFGIEFFPESYNAATSICSLKFGSSVEDIERASGRKVLDGLGSGAMRLAADQKGRGGSVIGASKGILAAQVGLVSDNPSGPNDASRDKKPVPPSTRSHLARQQFRRPTLASNLASIDLTSSFEQHDKSQSGKGPASQRGYLCKSKRALFANISQELVDDTTVASKPNQSGHILRRTASELSLYSNASASSSSGPNRRDSIGNTKQTNTANMLRDTKLIIILQVCLPFILAGFGNMAAGLVLNSVAKLPGFVNVPIFFVLLPPLIGMKGNIEMTLASRLSTLSNLNILDTSHQKRRAYLSNLILTISQAIALSTFAAFISILYEYSTGGAALFPDSVSFMQIAVLVVLATALVTSILLVMLSNIIMVLAVSLARLIRVNPDNLSTLVAALYGDVSFVLVYGLVASWMYSFRQLNTPLWPIAIICATYGVWPLLLFIAYKFRETSGITLSSLPPMLTSIVISMGSGIVLSSFIGRYKLIALYQPVVNGFGANLIAVQASRVSTWLWCSELRKISNQEAMDKQQKTFGSLASFVPEIPELNRSEPFQPRLPTALKQTKQFVKTLLWSFCNPSPNSIAARLLLLMMIPAQTIYFFVIWLLSPSGYIVVTWQFYSFYMVLCFVQVFILLTICEPLMTFLMSRNLDPDVFGISTLMALADLTGTLCLATAFVLLARVGDVNAL